MLTAPEIIPKEASSGVRTSTDYNKNTGRISIDGDDWKAISADNSIIEKGNHVTILKVESVILTVKQE